MIHPPATVSIAPSSVPFPELVEAINEHQAELAVLSLLARRDINARWLATHARLARQRHQRWTQILPKLARLSEAKQQLADAA